MDLYDFLKQMVAGDLAHVAVAAAFVGILVFGIIEFIDSRIKKPQTPTDPGNPGLDHNFKFWGAMVLSFLLPLLAYLYVSWVDKQPINANGIFLAGGVGYVASQGIHWATERNDNKPETQTNLPT
jgi:hypothetical protein